MWVTLIFAKLVKRDIGILFWSSTKFSDINRIAID